MVIPHGSIPDYPHSPKGWVITFELICYRCEPTIRFNHKVEQKKKKSLTKHPHILMYNLETSFILNKGDAFCHCKSVK